MSTIALKNAAYVANVPLFSNLDLTVSAGDRIGLVAGNGTGKTTLLKCMAGTLELSGGEIMRARGLRVGYVEQDVPDNLRQMSLYEAVQSALPEDARETESWRVDVALAALSTPETLYATPVLALSGGWQRLMLIARVWVTDPDLLLLDEPTNHLDMEKIVLLEDWLRTGLGEVPVIIASHDRSFLDAVSNRTLFLRPDKSRLFALPYSAARAALDQEDQFEAAKQEKDLKEAQRLRTNAAKLKNVGVNSGSDLLEKKAKQLKARAEKIEDAAKSLYKERSGDIRLANRGTHAKVLIAIEDVTVTKPDGEKLFAIPKLHIFQGDRIVLLGANGTGKSRLVAMLRAATDGDVTGIRVSPSLVPGYLDQALSNVPADATPFGFIADFGLGDQRTRALLAGAGVAVEKQGRKIGTLSFGQRARLGLLALRLAEPNFYLMDEPTNHVDIAGQEALEAEILEHEASCVLVSHDRQFVRNIGTRFLMIDKRRLIEMDDPETFFVAMLA
jgi:ATPase subunit of ABC transporter with duplicated ATPase domains